jgi:cell division protein FtsI (penicillin-binding protein 3)
MTRTLNLARPSRKSAAAIRRQQRVATPPASRYRWILAGLIGLFMTLLGRAAFLHLLHSDFLQDQGEARSVRVVPMPARRGMLLDRNGETLAASTPVDSLWVNAPQFIEARAQWPDLAGELDLSVADLDLSVADLDKLLAGREQREFVYLKRHLPPEQAARIQALRLPGTHLQREYRRYYPVGEAAAHVLGFTNIDGLGQEGLERALNPLLHGVAGSRKVLQDPRGQVIAELQNLQMPADGRDIRLSLDQRIQYLAHRELTAAAQAYQARGASAVILDVQTGEVLAMVNYPGYNPNNRDDRDSNAYRNRAVTDVFEPGSTMKPFTLAAGLESRQYTPSTIVSTAPGSMRVGKYRVRDARNYGNLTVAGVLLKSSNVGAARIALSLTPLQHWQILNAAGFGQIPGSGFPGEASGRLENHADWGRIRQASLAFGYGLNVSLLQLAHAYTAIANDGVLPPLRFTPVGETPVFALAQPTRVMRADTARQVRAMMEGVVSAQGTAPDAAIPGYRVGGKTGTARKAEAGGYSSSRYHALFAGIAPLDKPRLVMAILLDEPQGEEYYGGQVAAPVFASVMSGALRLLNIPPDAIPAGKK